MTNPRKHVMNSSFRSSFRCFWYPLFILVIGFAWPLFSQLSAEEQIRPEEAREAILRAGRFFVENAAEQGGYVWKYSHDLKFKQGEGVAYDQRIWIQPPGTPAVGMALLRIHEVTGDSFFLSAAKETANALLKGQLYSGGWHYSVTFDPEKRKTINYRLPPSKGDPKVTFYPQEPGGWDIWRQRRYKSNQMVIDDDTTPAALRFLMTIDQTLHFENEQIHEAVEYGLGSILKAQHPVGAWSHNYDRYPKSTPDLKHYPILQATFPETWSRKWTKDFQGCYVLNDRITLNVIQTLLDAYEIYEKKEYLTSALRGGRFLILSQMPEPQPAWAQQYNRKMQPVWDRHFEPPAITSLESQDVIETLFLLYRKTKQEQFLEPVPKAIRYLKESQFKDGKLSRFYELQTNKPLFFTKKYEMTNDRAATPDHYRFLVSSRLDRLTKEYEMLSQGNFDADIHQTDRDKMSMEVLRIIKGMDERGAWLEPGFVRDPNGKKASYNEGIINSQTFNKNIRVLCDYLQATKE